MAESSPFRKLAAFIIATNGSRRSLAPPPPSASVSVDVLTSTALQSRGRSSRTIHYNVVDASSEELLLDQITIS